LSFAFIVCKKFLLFSGCRGLSHVITYSVQQTLEEIVSVLNLFHFRGTGRPSQNGLAKKEKKKGRFLAPVPEKSRLQVELDQRHKESPFLALPSAVLALFSAYM
jgi:hypothetical protein